MLDFTYLITSPRSRAKGQVCPLRPLVDLVFRLIMSVEEVEYYPKRGLSQVKTMLKTISMKVGAKSSYPTH